MPVTTPHLTCTGCGRQRGIWSPLCTECEDVELPPCVGTKFAETTDHIFRAAEQED